MSKKFRSSGLRGLMVLPLVGVLALAGSAMAAPPKSPSVQVIAKGSVNDVLGNLKKMVADNGMMVMGELHQGKVLAMTGLKVESESIFVGNPTVGKKLFSAEPGAGLVVPVRINIFRNAAGKTVVSYFPPSYLLSGFHNPMVDKIAGMLDGKLAGMTKMLAK